jgi:hypothetical protein
METIRDRNGRPIGYIHSMNGVEVAKDRNGRTLATYHPRTDVTSYPDGSQARGDRLMREF